MAFKKKQNHDFGYREWKRELDAKQYRSWYVTAGDEPYLIRSCLSLLESGLIAPGCESLDLIKLRDGFDEERLLQELRTIPFMSERRVIELYGSDLFNSKGGNSEHKREYLTRIAEALHPQVCLCFIEEQVDMRQKKSLELLEKAGGKYILINRESDELLKQWLASFFAKDSLRISTDAAESLIQRCEASMDELSGEMKKLRDYCIYAKQEVIDADTVELCCKADLQGNIFKLTDAVSAGRSDEALVLLDKMLRSREAPTLIHFMLARHFRQLLCAKDCRNGEEAAEKMKLMSFVGRRLTSQASRFKEDKLKELCRMSFELDLQVKTGEIEDRTAIELMIIRAGSRAG